MKIIKFCCLLATAVVLSGCSGSPEENLVAAIRAAETGNWKLARKHADRAAGGAPDHVGALVMRAIACEKNENYDQAVDSARRAAKLDPNSFAALYTLGRLYSSNPLRNAEAINTLNMALRIRPESAETKILICNIFSRMEADAGYNYLNRLQKDPDYKDDPALLSQKGVILAKNNKIREAYNCFVRAFKAAGNDPDVVFNTARFFTYYSPNRNFSRQLYSRFEQLASGREKYTAELDEARAAMAR